MRVLTHIHTFNDADIIAQTIESVRRQTRPVDEILVVDNGSTDATLDQPVLKEVTVLRQQENLGTSGAVLKGLKYALEHDYDWLWVFDADSTTEPDALEQLLALYESFPEDEQQRIAYIACLSHNPDGSVFFPGALFNDSGIDQCRPETTRRHYPVHFTLWSGCLYRLKAVREIGLPNPDYMLDWGELEYGYRVMQSGFEGFILRDAILHHNIRGFASLTPYEVKRRGATRTIFDLRPMRCYYSSRNRFYFVLYDFAGRRSWLVLRETLGQVMLMISLAVVQPSRHGRHLLACCRGIWHGLTGNIAARY